MKTDKIRVDIHISGQGKEAHEYEYCPIKSVVEWEGSICPLISIQCVFGLTTSSPPDLCPLRDSGVKMKFTTVNT
jgi:hypothetical protein